MVKNWPATQETQVQFLAGKFLWRRECHLTPVLPGAFDGQKPARLQSMGWQRRGLKESARLSGYHWVVGGGFVAGSASDSATLWTVAHQAPLSMGLSRQEHWRGLLFSPGDLPDPGIEPASPMPPALQADSLLPELMRKPVVRVKC